MELLKLCSGCKEVKSISLFHKLKLGKYGVASACKACTSEYRKQKYPIFRQQRIEKMRAYSKTEQARDVRKKYDVRPEVKAKHRSYDKYRKKRDKDKILKRMRAYNQREEVKHRMREWARSADVRDRIKFRHKEHRIELHDNYVKEVISKQSNGILKFNEIPENLIDAKRQSLILKRTIKQKQDEQHNNTTDL